MGRGVLAGALLCALGAAPPASSISGKVVVTRAGAPVPDASGVVVYLIGFEEPPPEEPATLLQEGRTFHPLLLPVTKGAKVTFPNKDDNTNHNVFSHKPKFNLGQFRPGQGKPPSRVMSALGPVDIYCNIHPEMAATILVLPNRRFAVTGRDGAFRIEGVPEGTWDVFAYDRHALKPVRGKVTVAAGAQAKVDFEIEQTRFDFSHKNFYGTDYRKDYD